jgi:hypothetical protein
MAARNQKRIEHRSIADAAYAQLLAGRQGYADARAGKGYATEYDLWTENEQLAYETGRLWHSNLCGAQLRPPAWRSLMLPARLQAANLAADAAVGTPIPLGRRPASTAPVLLEPEPPPPRRRRRR